MRSSLIYSVALTGLASAAPVIDFGSNTKGISTQDGFPNPSQAQIAVIQKDAKGTLSNAPPPGKVSDTGITSLKLIALNELSEVAFFSELLYNVTNKVTGYDLGTYATPFVQDMLTAIIAQEKLHLLNANGALQKFSQQPIQPCKYNFQVTNFQDAILLAQTFTDLVLGTLQDVNEQFAINGDIPLIRGLSSVIANEAEQVGAFRLIQSKRPSAQPFMTTAARDFAFTALQGFTIPGSCPNINTIPLKTFKPLNVQNSARIAPKTQDLTMTIASADMGSNKVTDLSIVLVNGQNLPIVKALGNPQTNNGVVTFTVPFGYDENIMAGLTLAAVCKGQGPFANMSQVVDATIMGPGLIEVYDINDAYKGNNPGAMPTGKSS